MSADEEILWTPGWEWLAAVLTLHGLVALPWIALLGAWPLLPCAASLGYYGWAFSRREVWRFALVEERAVLFEPTQPAAKQAGRQGWQRPATLRGSPWITPRWVVVRTSRRVLTLRAGRYDAARFARLRRALLASRGAGASSSGSAAG